MASLADRHERLASDMRKIRAAIRKHDASCWGEHFDLFFDPFMAGAWAGGAADDVKYRLRSTLQGLCRYAAERDALACLQAVRMTPFPLREIRGPAGRSLVHDAARRGAQGVLTWLVDEQILAVNTRADHDLTPLHYAAQGGHLGAVERLLARHAFIDAATRDGTTALHEAIYAHHDAVAEALIRAGANLSATTGSEQTPLRGAVQRGRRRIADLLLARGAVTYAALPDVLRFYGVRILAHSSLKDLSLVHCDPHALGRLFEELDPADARRLLERGADPTTSAIYALRNTKHELLATLREHDPLRFTDAHYRSAAESVLGMRQLLAHGGDPDAIVQYEYRPERLPLIFYVATESGTDLEAIPLLLDHGADPAPPAQSTPPFERGTRPLIVALVAHRHDSAPVLRELVARGQDVNARDSNDRTALHALIARRADDAVTLQELLRLGAAPDTEDATGCTPLMYAVAGDNLHAALQLTDVLLAAGANVHAVDRQRRTVLHHVFAAKHARYGPSQDRLPLLQRLLRAGADLHARDAEGHLPEDAGDPKEDGSLRDTLRRLRTRAALDAAPPSGRPARRREPGL